MGKVNAAATEVVVDNSVSKLLTPRTRPAGAPKESARYKGDFQALPEDVLEYAVYLGMDPKVKAPLMLDARWTNCP